MLSLEPPFYQFADVVIYRDHAVPTLFYYAAPQPRIARDAGRLMFDLMAYTVELKHSVLSGTTIPDELGAGFLTMGTECPLPDGQREDIVRGLQQATGQDPATIVLYPIPYHKGKVTVLALDQYTQPGQPPASAGSPEPLSGRPSFVLSVLGSGIPSLLGDLRTIFSLGLSEQGVEFLQGLYEDRAAPVGVVYELTFYGLRPAVQARITADMSRVYTHFGGGLNVGYAFARADVQAALDYLVEHDAIHVEIISQAVGDEAARSKELAMSLFRDKVIQDFFRPTAVPPGAPLAPGDSLGTAAGAAAGAIGGGAAAGTAGASARGAASSFQLNLTLQYKRQEELKTITYDFSEQSPEERTHAPQGFLPMLLSADDLRQHIHQVDLGSPFFETLDILATGPAKEDFAALSIRQVTAVFTYGQPTDPVSPESETLVFRADSTGDKVVGFKRRERRSLAYAAGLTYDFFRDFGTPGGAVSGDSFQYTLPPRGGLTGRSLLINPSADFGVLALEVEPGRLDPEVEQVDVDLTYRSPDKKFTATRHMRISPGQTPGPDTRWQVRTLEVGSAAYTAAYTFYFRKDEHTGQADSYVAPVASFSDPLLRVDTPFVGERELLVKPVPASDQVQQITVDLTYADDAHRYTRHKQVVLKPPFQTERVSWPLLDTAHQAVTYQVTIDESGTISSGDEQSTSDPSIVVGSGAHRVLRISVQLVGPALPDVSLDALRINALPAASLPADGSPPTDDPVSLLLTGTAMTGSIALNLPPGAPPGYAYQTVAFKTDGSMPTSDWKTVTGSLLVIQTRNLG